MGQGLNREAFQASGRQFQRCITLGRGDRQQASAKISGPIRDNRDSSFVNLNFGCVETLEMSGVFMLSDYWLKWGVGVVRRTLESYRDMDVIGDPIH